MANITISPLTGRCIPPFLDVTKFPPEGGHIIGRLCAPLIAGLADSPICCLPCPITDWIYDDDFETYGVVSEWLNVVSVVLLAFMLLSYLVLPTQQTRRHYLSICLTISVMMIGIGFTIPLAAQPEKCYNEITPHDMYSSTECAFSGAFIVAGGLSVVAWILLRALSMNLQICFDIVPGRRFFYASQAFGWGISAILFAATMTFTGVSFRFGNACHVNHENSMAGFWGPLLAMAGGAAVLQFITFVYCVKVYLKNLWTDQSGPSSSNGSVQLNSYSGALGTHAARAVWRRLQKVLWLQWRGITIVTIILVDVIFFSIVFVYMDSNQSSVRKDRNRIMPWILCLAAHPNDRDQCLPLAQNWLVTKSMVLAVLMMLSLAGVELFVFLTRPSVFPAWIEYFRKKASRQKDFVSLDAQDTDFKDDSKHHLLHRSRSAIHTGVAIEMYKPSGRVSVTEISDAGPFKSPRTTLSSPSETYQSPLIRQSPISPFVPSLNSPNSTPQMPSAAMRSPPLKATSPPLAHHNREPGDYFNSMQRRSYKRQDSSETLLFASANRPISPTPATLERRYHAPTTSFSGIKHVPRQTSLRENVQIHSIREETKLQPAAEISSPSASGSHLHQAGLKSGNNSGSKDGNREKEKSRLKEEEEEEEFASWRRHDLWARDSRFKRSMSESD